MTVRLAPVCLSATQHLGHSPLYPTPGSFSPLPNTWVTLPYPTPGSFSPLPNTWVIFPNITPGSFSSTQHLGHSPLPNTWVIFPYITPGSFSPLPNTWVILPIQNGRMKSPLPYDGQLDFFSFFLCYRLQHQPGPS